MIQGVENKKQVIIWPFSKCQLNTYKIGKIIFLRHIHCNKEYKNIFVP